MRSEAHIQKRLRDFKKKHLIHAYERDLGHHHYNCVHNHRHVDKHGEAFLCMLGADDPENWKGTICDSDDTVKTCPYFQGRHSKEEVKETFLRDLQNTETLFEEYRDVAILQWVLESPMVTSVEEKNRTWFQKFKDWVK